MLLVLSLTPGYLLAMALILKPVVGLASTKLDLNLSLLTDMLPCLVLIYENVASFSLTHEQLQRPDPRLFKCKSTNRECNGDSSFTSIRLVYLDF